MNANPLRRFGTIFVVSGAVALCFVHPRMLTWQDRVLVILGFGFLATGFWLFAIKSIRDAKQTGKISSAAIIFALLGSIALALLLFGPCSVI